MRAIGSPFVLTGDTTVIRSDGGNDRTRVWEGTQAAVRANHLALVTGVKQDGDEVTIDESGPVCRLIHRSSVTPFSGLYQVQVTVEANVVQKSIFEPPLPDAFANLTSTQINAVRDSLLDEDGESARDGLGSDAQRRLFDIAKAGVEYRVVYQPILSKTTVAPSNARFLYSYANVGAVLSTSTMLVDSDLNEGLLRFTLPNEGWAGIGIPASYGWLKIYPAVTGGSHSATVLTQQYHYGLWLDDLYDYIG